jgi:CRP-like cAMP-binding protein
VWDWLILALTVYTIVVWGVYLGFAQGWVAKLYLVDWVINIIFLVDVWLSTHTWFTDERGTTVTDPVRIRSRCVKSLLFKLNVASVVPLEILGWIFEDYAVAILLLRLNYVLRVARIVMNSRFDAPNPSTRIFKLILVWIITAHVYASLFAWVGTFDEDGTRATWITFYGFENESKGDLYIIALYYSVVTLSSVGYGDIHPVSVTERALAIPSLAISMLLYATTVGLLTKAIESATHSTTLKTQKLDRIKGFASAHSLPKELRKKLLAYASADYQLHKGFDMAEILQLVPKGVQSGVMGHLYTSVVTKAEFFQNCSPKFVSEIVVKLQTSICLDGDTIFNQAETSSRMYFLHYGQVSITQETPMGQSIVLATIMAESTKPFFGELGLLTGDPRGATATAVGKCFLWYLEQKDFMDVMRSFPEEEKMIRATAIKRLELDEERETKERESFSQQHLGINIPPSPSRSRSARQGSLTSASAARLQENLRLLRNDDTMASHTLLSPSNLASPVHTSAYRVSPLIGGAAGSISEDGRQPEVSHHSRSRSISLQGRSPQLVALLSGQSGIKDRGSRGSHGSSLGSRGSRGSHNSFAPLSSRATFTGSPGKIKRGSFAETLAMARRERSRSRGRVAGVAESEGLEVSPHLHALAMKEDRERSASPYFTRHPVKALDLGRSNLRVNTSSLTSS